MSKKQWVRVKMIDLFDSHYEFLSNFYMSRFDFDGTSYSSAEHAFQAAKTLDESEKFLIEDQPTPGKAKKMGRKATLRSDWEEVKVGIMEQIVRAKFSQIPERAMLLATGDEELVEGN